MTSILTNSAAIAALATLRSIDANMERTQNAISSGYKIGSAADNAAYWSIATTMRSDNAALSTVQDALGLAAAKSDTAYSGLDQTISLISQIKQKLTAAQEPGVDKDKVQKEITELKNQLVTVAQSASFSSENWLYNTSTAALGTKTMVGSFTRTNANTISIQTIDYDASKSVLFDKNNANLGQLTKGVTVTQPSGATTTTATYFLVNITSTTPVGGASVEIKIDSNTSANNLTGMLSAVDAMLQSVTDAAATLGAAKSRIDTQNSFVKNLSEVIGKGIGRLVDADMNEESTRLKALQTQQQLGIQSLSIANTNAQNLMQLFR
jgi:flagellin